MARTDGAKTIPKAKKARILAQVNVGLCTKEEIAAKEGVSLSTVRMTTNESVRPDVLAMAERFQRQFQTYADATALKAVERAYDTVNELPADKAAAVAEKFFNMGRVSRGEATSYTQNAPGETAHKLLAKAIENGAPREEAIEYICGLMNINREVFEK